MYMDGKRYPIDFKMSKKFNTFFDVLNIARIEVEFPLYADFSKFA
jgi:hypothetical protein